MPKPSDLIYFEDFDLNGDGILDVNDSMLWGNIGRGDVVNYIQGIVNGNEVLPEHSSTGMAQNGPAAVGGLGAVGGNKLNLDTREGFDKITDTLKVTAGYFTNGDGTLEGNTTFTTSLADSNEKYYFNVCQAHPTSASAETQLSITYGHIHGSGSDTKGDTGTSGTLKGETEVIYKQFANLLLRETEITGGFKISSVGSHGTARGDRDPDFYAIVGKRKRFKDRINKGTWTLNLSGSLSGGLPSIAQQKAGSGIKLTDDSKYNKATFTVAGPRYSIISGAAGTVSGAAATTTDGQNAAAFRTYGWFYPEMGIMIFSATELSASLPGPNSAVTCSFSEYTTDSNYLSSSGFAPNLDDGAATNNALRMVNAMSGMGSSTSLRLRSEEDQTQLNYFCRVKSGQMNFSNNPTFVSGSTNTIRNASMRGNPTTFITGVGLYNEAGNLVAIAKLSSAIKKNFSSEATIKVKLTY